MRDDLHKSVPPRTSWTKVLRLACEHASDEDLRDAVTLAIHRDADWLTSPWGRDFERALDLGSSDLFAEDKSREELNALMASSPTPQARSALEMALGLLAREERVPPDFKNLVIGEALHVFGVDCVELVSSLVSRQYGEKQSTQIRQRLHGVLPSCDLLQDPPRRGPKGKLSVVAVLDLPLSVSL